MELSCDVGRSPHRERGLKSVDITEAVAKNKSLPPQGAWIEINRFAIIFDLLLWSLPPQGAWIEIAYKGGTNMQTRVAPPTGSVD